MAPDVQFNEDAIVKNSFPKARSVTLADLIIKAGLVNKVRDAEMILGLIAVALFFASYYLITVAIPPEQKLGQDVLRPGEVVPAYVSNPPKQND